MRILRYIAAFNRGNLYFQNKQLDKAEESYKQEQRGKGRQIQGLLGRQSHYQNSNGQGNATRQEEIQNERRQGNNQCG